MHSSTCISIQTDSFNASYVGQPNHTGVLTIRFLVVHSPLLPCFFPRHCLGENRAIGSKDVHGPYVPLAMAPLGRVSNGTLDSYQGIDRCAREYVVSATAPMEAQYADSG